MTKLNQKNHRLLTMAALLYLFVVRFLFYRLELNSGIDILRYSMESALYLFIYGMCLYGLPPIVPGICLVSGCVAFSFCSGFLPNPHPRDYLLPFAYFPVFLFLIDQDISQTTKGSNVLRTFCRWLLRLYPLVLLGLICFVLIKRFQRADLLSFFYGMVIFLLVGCVYELIMHTEQIRHTQKKNKKKERRVERDLFQNLKEAFWLAGIIIIETGLFLQMIDNIFLTHTIPILWIVNLLFLYEQGNSLVCTAFDKIQKRTVDFLVGTSHSGG